MSEGAYYYQPERPEPVDLLANPPYATGTEYQPASGTGAFLVDAERMVQEHGR
jgi:type I restriction-modification system DNA methylase subunit